MERCPACRASLSTQPVCPRCACDFTLARRAESAARRNIADAIRALAASDPAQAMRSLDRAQFLHRGELGESLRAAALTMKNAALGST